MPTNRQERVAPLVREEISTVVIYKMEDPRVKNITITRVKMTKDLKTARVYFSMMGTDKEVEDARKALTGAKGRFKKAIGENLELRYTPELEFFFDQNIEHADRIERILNEIKESSPPGEEE